MPFTAGVITPSVRAETKGERDMDRRTGSASPRQTNVAGVTKLVTVVAIGIIGVLGACSSSGVERPGERRVGAASEQSTKPIALPTEASTDVQDYIKPYTEAHGTTSGTAEQGKTLRAAPRNALRPLELPFEPKINVTATLSPRCVEVGNVFHLTVKSKPDAGVAYQAIYSDNKSGAGAPMGNGYGGNDAGYTDKKGIYLSEWTVAPHAPIGRGRVDVIVGWKHGDTSELGYDKVSFEIAPPGACSSK